MIAVRSVSLICVALVALGASPVRAQDDVTAADRQAGRAAYGLGVRAANDGQWEVAREQFQRAYDLARAPVILFNLGGAQRRTGHLLAAEQSFARFLEDVTEGDGARHREAAQESLEEVREAIPTISLTVDRLQPGDRVALDDRDVDHTELADPLRVDPGRHRIEVWRGEVSLARADLELVEAERRDVHLEVPPPPPDPADVAVVAPAPDPIAPPPEEPGRVGLWVGVAVGAAVLVAGAVVLAVVLASGSSSPDPWQGNYPPGRLEVP